MTDEELFHALGTLEVRLFRGFCELVIENATPAGWEVVIAAAGANFYYRDGSSDTDGPRPVQLRGGQKTSFFSKKPSGCVNKIYLAITVVAKGESGSKSYDATLDDVKPDECMRGRGLSFGPKRNVSEAQMLENDWQESFEIVFN